MNTIVNVFSFSLFFSLTITKGGIVLEARIKIAEGKTKIIWSFEEDLSLVTNLVNVESKDDITAGDGFRHDVIEGKGVLCTRIAANIFLLLQRRGIPNHFVRLIDGRIFLARRLLMMSMEIVVRRKAVGSFCQRHPEIVTGTVFEEPIVEFYLKDDRRHDPIIIWNGERDCFELYDAHTPISPSGFIGSLDLEQYIRSLGSLKYYCIVPRHLSDLIATKHLAIQAFIAIEQAWQRQGYLMSDFKIEVGWDQLGALQIGDVIQNDEWRLQRIIGETREEMSKQCYRDLKEVTSEALVEIRRKYEEVASVSDNFLH